MNPEAEAKAEELMKQLEEKNKLIAELRVRLPWPVCPKLPLTSESTGCPPTLSRRL